MSTSERAPSWSDRLRRTRPRRLVLCAVLVLLVLLALWTTFEARRALSGARQGQSAATQLQADLAASDWDAASDRAAPLARGVERLAGAMDSPPLRLAGWVPVVGRDVRAAREIAIGLRDASRGLQPLLGQAEGLDPESLVSGGRVDVSRIQDLAPAAARADQGLSAAERRISAVPAETLHGSLSQRVKNLQRQVRDLQRRGRVAAATAQQLPNMLGVDGSRRYLLAFQNPAEARPTGGIFGSYGVLEVQDGRLALVETGVNNDLGQLSPEDLAGIDADALRLYGNDLALSQNFNLSPRFPVAAELLDRLWTKHGGDPVDGVLSVDPLTLQAILQATGPVDVRGGPRLTGDNAAEILMQRIYVTLGGDTSARNAYLGAATEAVFGQLSKPGTAGTSVWSALAAQPARRHLMMWSRDDDENALLQDVGLTGALADPDAEAVGVFVTNADASKLDYYLRRSVVVEAPCGGNGPQITVSLRNDSPASVPPYSANKLDGAKATDRTLTVAWYLPPQRGLRRLTVDGKAVGFAAGSEKGWSVARTAVVVPRGRTVKVAVDLTGSYYPVTTVLDQPAVRPMKRVDAPCGG